MSTYFAVRNAFLGLLRRAGFQAQKVCPAHTAELAMATMLKGHGVDLVLDVGANVGQFGEELFEWGYQGKVVSFEPLSGPREALEKAAARHPGRWELAPRCALGAAPGEITVNISRNCIASSVLDLTPTMDEFTSKATYENQETVDLCTLDDVAAPWLESSSAPFLKIDVQGYEGPVLDGATQTLKKLAGLQIELSMIELYAGQQLFSELLRRLEDEGFTLYHLVPSFVDVPTGRWLQADGLFFRERARG